MISQDDLRASVSAGIVTEAQAAALMSLAHSRSGARENLAPGDEPFELFKGFNEIFIVVGMLILAVGWVGVVTFVVTNDPLSLKNTLIFSSLFAAASLWGMSEYFIRRRRMVAPAIALSIMFAINAAYGFAGAFSELFMVAQGDNSSLPLPFILATLALFAYWLRFRVPFALALIALAAFGVAILIAGNSSGSPGSTEELFLLSAGGPFAFITLALGLVVFAIAMMFDMSDPHRVTRRSANGFWLHVVAAPALVNTIALSLLDNDAGWSNSLLVAVLTLFALVAIIIDRRSFLIAAIGYTVILTATIFDGDGAVFTVFFLGIVLLFLGARWENIRARLLALLPGFIPLQKLPPSHVAKASS
ncbi:hypothetical protein ROLI_044040 [Roseobacter fucihabitans]|uniref:DUF2157 domain-containing protein n=1 Tax=Roseobacter fucihabitans TaxID=1537242 RepID=A0ABZ2BZ97_9RHOB|nr:hypothetical protein [Roseobacter litoralis]MBC6963883.1 hypothetical protein [Roseobacter litoralis]MBC6964032.1 hypothetical protein [Roseobacter litoralis]